MTREEAVIILDGFKNNPLFNDTHAQALDMAISALSDYDKMQEISLDLAFENDELINKSKWIPVSERLPEFRKEVLTCTNGGFIEIQSLEESYDGYWENQKGDWSDIDEVVAWMSLPEPYKKGE